MTGWRAQHNSQEEVLSLLMLCDLYDVCKVLLRITTIAVMIFQAVDDHRRQEWLLLFALICACVCVCVCVCVFACVCELSEFQDFMVIVNGG